MNIRRVAVCILMGIAACALLPQAAFAQSESAATSATALAATSGSDLTVKIAVMGPGNELYFWWGHIALVIEDARTGRSRFYDYGLFSFENDSFFVNFAFGRLWYSCGASSTTNNVNGYIYTNRDVTMYTLDIPPERREEVRRKAEWDVLPENRDYLYNHFKHNCATPIINIIDMATDGQFKERYFNEPGRFTLRQHVRRHTWFSPFIDWILNFWMGQDIDTGITVWDEMFLPSEVAARISEFEYTDSWGFFHPLVMDTEVVFESQGRPAVLDVPRKQWPRELVFSLFVSLLLGCLFYLQSKSVVRGQVLLGATHSLLGIFFGGAGLLLYFLSLCTNHDYTWHNANILFAGPLLLIAFPLGIRYAVSKNYNSRLKTEFALRMLWLLVALGIFVSMLIKLLPWFWQQNLTDQMLMLPIALTLALEPVGLKRMARRIFWRWL